MQRSVFWSAEKKMQDNNKPVYMKTIQEFNFKDKKALVRVDFNVPQDEELKVTDNNFCLRFIIQIIGKKFNYSKIIVLLFYSKYRKYLSQIIYIFL